MVGALGDAGLTAGDIAGALTQAVPLSVVELAPDPEAGEREALAFVSVILLFVGIQLAGAYILMGVFEEKSTKVVELVLSSIRARDLLLGKVFGVGILGVIQIRRPTVTDGTAFDPKRAAAARAEPASTTIWITPRMPTPKTLPRSRSRARIEDRTSSTTL
ncbi:MAG: ABC transporter permease, partial [Actinomycetota bacterium]